MACLMSLYLLDTSERNPDDFTFEPASQVSDVDKRVTKIGLLLYNIILFCM